MKKQNKDRLLELIREGKNYKETKEIFEKETGDKVAGATFYRAKETVFPSEKMDAALEGAREKRVDKEKGEKTQQRRAKWTTQKQKSADESKLAELINTGVYHGVFPFCRSKQLKIEDVKSINIGGAAVANILYFFPDVNLDHPAIVLVTRMVLFYIRFRSICSSIREKVDETKEKAAVLLSGVKSDWKK